jgi:hypothetical protein
MGLREVDITTAALQLKAWNKSRGDYAAAVSTDFLLKIMGLRGVDIAERHTF